MKLILIPATLALSGCWTIPAVPDFPRLPEPTTMNIPCPTLEQLKPDPTISDLSTVLNTNYHRYYECAVKVDSWNAWYRQQRELYNRKLNK